MRKTKSILAGLAFLFLFHTPIFAQTKTTTPLTEIIQSIEKRLNVRFSYTLATIKNQEVIPPDSQLDLEETLTYLKSKTNLEFKIIGNRYIAIYTAISSGNLSICGTVINMETGLPIQGVTIVSEAGVVSTDEAGSFQMTGISRGETITLAYLGFDIKRIISDDLITETQCPLVFANISINFLDTVVVENYIAKGISKNADGSVSISRQNFEISPSLVETDILQIAQLLPGIESADETAGNINIRGGKNDEVLLLWDNIRLYQSSHFFGLISALNPNLTNNVTIYKNGTHPKFGESTSGVISITSEENVPEEVTGGAGINLISANLYAQIPASETFAFNISGRTSINSGIGNPVYNQFYSRVFQNTVITNLDNNTELGLRSSDENFNFFDVSIKGIWDITEKDKLTYSYLGINNKLEFTELFVANDGTNSNQSTLKQSSNVNGLQYQRHWSSKFSTKLNWHASNYNLEESNRDVNTETTLAQENDLSESEFKFETTYRFSKKLLTTGGYNYTDTNIANKVDSIPVSDRSLRRSGYFLNLRWKLNNENTIISAGSRLTSYPSFESSFLEPRINVFQQITNRWSVSVSGEQKNQGVLQFTDVENPFLGVENRRWLLANNNDLPIMESQQISLGTTFKKTSWALNVNAYYKKVDNISSTTQGFRNQLINVNTLGSYDATGIEFSVQKKSEAFNAWLSYSFVESEYDFTELEFSRFANNFAIRHSLNLAATYRYRSFLFSMGSNFKTGNPYTSVVENNEIIMVNGQPIINFNPPNGDTLDSYFRTDFSAAYNFKLDDTFSGKINLALLNIFNRKNALETYYRLQTNANGETSVNKIEQFSLGFTPNISFQLLF
ncbi:MAG: TonB-dependent receptor [Bacteroidota bacterium]